MNIIPGEQARRDAARWTLWGYMGLAVLGIVLHLARNITAARSLNGIYLSAMIAIGGVAYVSLKRLELSLSRAMMLFAWMTFGALVLLLDTDIRIVNQPTDIIAMFLVGVCTLGFILGFKAAVYCRLIAKNGRKINNIIDELLLFSAVRELDEIDVGPLDMAAIVREALQRLSYLMDEKPATVTVVDEWPAALGYAPWVVEMWVNYISNALKYGGNPPCIELGCTLRKAGSVTLERASHSQPPAASLQFWVRDNGAGLSPEEQTRLFTPFTRFNQVRAKGHGLGLSIVRRIAERLGGEVGVESVVGQGSVFFFTLPAASLSDDERDAPTLTD